MPNWNNPSVTEQLLFSTVRLERRTKDGTPFGAGTGFLVQHTDGTRAEVFLVSNRHVILGAAKVAGYFTRKSPSGAPEIGNVFWVDLTSGVEWRGHPDMSVDLCATPMDWRFQSLLRHVSASAYFIAPSSSLLATEEDLAGLDPLMEVMLVGYPNGIFDTHNFMPLFRQGVTASHPALNFGNRPEFLIDAAVFPGSSGSPVFSYSRSIDGPVCDYRILGVLRSVRSATARGDLTMMERPTALGPVVTYEQPLNLGTVIKSPVIRAFLCSFAAAPILPASSPNP